MTKSNCEESSESIITSSGFKLGLFWKGVSFKGVGFSFFVSNKYLEKMHGKYTNCLKSQRKHFEVKCMVTICIQTTVINTVIDHRTVILILILNAFELVFNPVTVPGCTWSTLNGTCNLFQVSCCHCYALMFSWLNGWFCAKHCTCTK